MALYLGIDGGGTGCRAALADEGGRVLGRAEAGPANIAYDPEGARANILAAARGALAQAGRGDDLASLAAGLSLAGVNATGAEARLRAGLPFARLAVASDAVAAAKGALGDADGIVAALGTGSVFVAQRGGRVRRIGGWGLALSDEGSGAWIGRAILARGLRAHDGFVAMTPFLSAILAEHGGAEGVTAFSLGARTADYAALAPRAVGSDDEAARAVMERATADVAEAIALLQGDDRLPVAFLGGLGATYATRLAGRWEVRPARGTALDGALKLAREAA